MKLPRRIQLKIPRPRIPTIRLPSLPRLPGRAEIGERVRTIIGKAKGWGPYAAAGCAGLALLALCALALGPAVAESLTLSSRITRAHRAIATAQNDPLRVPINLQVKIATAEAGRDRAALPYLYESQVTDLPTVLYECARLSGVEVIALSQPVSRSGKPGEYEVRTLHLQVTGPVGKLVGFVSLIRQASSSGFVVANLNLVDQGAMHTLDMDIQLFVSPYAPLTPAALPTATLAKASPSPAASATRATPKPTGSSPAATATRPAGSTTAPAPTATATRATPTRTVVVPTVKGITPSPYPEP